MGDAMSFRLIMPLAWTNCIDGSKEFRNDGQREPDGFDGLLPSDRRKLPQELIERVSCLQVVE